MQLAYLSLLSLAILHSASLVPNYTPQYTLSSPTYKNFNFISFAPKPITNKHNKLVNTVLCVNNSTFIFIYIDNKNKNASGNRDALYQVPESHQFKKSGYDDDQIKHMDWTQSGIVVVSNYSTILYNPFNMTAKYQIKTPKGFINVQYVYIPDSDKLYFAIQERNSNFVQLYENDIKKNKTISKSSSKSYAHVLFDNSGRYIYYLEQKTGLKLVYDIQQDKEFDRQPFQITTTYSSSNAKPMQIAITRTGQFLLWPDSSKPPIRRRISNIKQSMFRVSIKPYSEYIYAIFEQYSKIVVLRINFQQADIELIQEIKIPGNGEVGINDSVRDFDTSWETSSTTIATIISDKQKFRDNMYLSIYRDLGEEKQSGWLWLFVALLVTVLTVVLSVLGWKKGNKCCFFIFKAREASLLKQEMRDTVNPYASSIQDNTSERYTSYGDPRNYIEPINLPIPPANQKLQNKELPNKAQQLKLYSNKQQQNQKITDEKKACIKQSNIDVISLSSSSQSKYSIQTQNSKSNISVNKSKQGTTQPQKTKTMFLTKTFNLKPKQKQDYVHVQKQQQQKQAQIQMMSMSQAHSQSHSEKESRSRVRDRDNDTSFDIHSQSDKQSINIQFGNMRSDLKDENLML